MKKEFTYIERKGLPGGPNEMFTYVTGVFSTEGYKRNSPDVNNPFNVIPSGNITMKDVDFPVMGTDNLGNSEMMMPGNDYQFPGDQVFEVPMAQARTKNGKIKTLPKAQSGKSIVPTSKFISNKESERLGLKKEIDYTKLANNFDNFDVIGRDELQTSSFNNQDVFTGGTTQDSLALYNNAMLSAKFYEQAVEDDGDGYQLRNTVEVGKNDVDEIFENFDPDMLNRGARFMGKAAPGRNKNKVGSSDDRNKFINKDLIQAGDFSYIGTGGATATYMYPDIAPPALLHRNIKPDKWKVYYTDKTADYFDNDATYRLSEGDLLDIANVPAYDPVKVYPKSQGPVPKEAYKYSDIEEPKEFSRYVNIHGNNYGFNTKEEFIDIARRKNLPQGWIEANIPKDLESQTKESIAKLQTGGEYIVKSGDTFDGIANKVGVKRKDLELANPGARNKLLQLNQKLLVPSTSIKTKDVYSTVSKVPSDFLPEPELNIEALKKGIAQAESLSGKLMVNPQSTATGLYGQRFSELEDTDLYKGTRKDFAKDIEAQNKVFEIRLSEGIDGKRGLIEDAEDLYAEYSPQIEGFDFSKEELIALANFLGRQGTRNYLGYHIRDGKPLSEALPNIYGSNAAQANKTPEQYLKTIREYLQKDFRAYSKGGELNDLKIYSNYINGVYDNTPQFKQGSEVYDKLNRVYYSKAKAKGLSSPNYIMSYIIN